MKRPHGSSAALFGDPAIVVATQEDSKAVGVNGEPYLDDNSNLGGLIRPGRTIIVDLHPWIEKDETLGLFIVIVRIFASTKVAGGRSINS